MKKVAQYTSDYWQIKLNKREVTLVNFEPKGGQNPSKCWSVFRKFVDCKQLEDLPAIYRTVRDFAICPPCMKVIKYGNSAGVLVKHIRSKSCKVKQEIKDKFKLKRSSSSVLTPPKGNVKKMKQSLLCPRHEMRAELPVFDPEEQQMFRKKMLIWDLGVVNKDLRPFNIFEGSGMKARDQAL